MKKYALVLLIVLFNACASESAPSRQQAPTAGKPALQSPARTDTIPPAAKPKPDSLKATPPLPDSTKPADKPKVQKTEPVAKPDPAKAKPDSQGQGAAKPAQNATATTPKPGTATPLPADQLQVVRVLGTVKNLSDNGKILRTRDKFRKTDKLGFASPNDRLALVDAKAGNFIARPAETPTGYKLDPTTASFNTRPGGITNDMVFRNYLNNRRLLILGDEAYIEVSSDAFPMDDSRFFYLQYQYEGEPAPVNKKLSFAGRRILLNKTEIFRIDGQPVSPAKASGFELFYYDDTKRASQSMGRFDLVLPDEQSLLEEVGTLVTRHQSAGSDDAKIREEVGVYLETFYGMPEPANLSAWLKKHFGL